MSAFYKFIKKEKIKLIMEDLESVFLTAIVDNLVSIFHIFTVEVVKSEVSITWYLRLGYTWE